MQQTEDGGVRLAEQDLPDVWGFLIEDGNLYVSVGLHYSGEGVENVGFSADNGFFATRNTKEVTWEGAPKFYAGNEYRLVMVGNEFQERGSTLTLTGDTMEEGLPALWGSHDTTEFPEEISILYGMAKATFTDGTVHEIPLTIPLNGSGAGTMTLDPSDLEGRRKSLGEDMGPITFEEVGLGKDVRLATVS